jgi:hypothetical protein
MAEYFAQTYSTQNFQSAEFQLHMCERKIIQIPILFSFQFVHMNIKRIDFATIICKNTLQYLYCFKTVCQNISKILQHLSNE